MDLRTGTKAPSRATKWLRVLLMLVGIGVGAVTHAGTVTYVYTDAQGTPLAKADASGNIIATFDYAPYGAQALGTPPSGPGYTGHVNDPDTGLVYMQARYYDPAVGRFLSVDPLGPVPGDGFNFNRYSYASNNPARYTDPDGRNATAFIGALFVETGHFLTGHGFNGVAVGGALNDGYNGEGDGMLHAALEDAMTVAAVASVAGAIKGIASVAVRQTGEKVVANLAKNAVKDDVKGSVRQIVKNGGEKQFQSDAASAMKGAKVKTYQTDRGPVRVGTHADGSTISTRSFSSSSRPTIQVEQPEVEITTKVRYEKDR